ncbi:Zinc finger CCCH-type with G patch domain-containing protein, partial [Armadillidium nasatum]
LDEVSAVIEVANDEDKAKLQELQINLINILELTLSQLNSLQKNSDNEVKKEKRESSSSNSVKCSSDNLDDEFEKFKSELADLNEEDEYKIENSKEMEKLNESLKTLEGQNVRVPFSERWGGFSYHNAVVLSVVEEENPTIAFENPQVTVLFSQPTSISMLPCRFFLDGRCKFDSDKCKFSHGEKVSVEKLKEYTIPDRDKIISGSNVLALHEGQDIWHRGKVEDVLEDRAGFSFNCTNCGTVYEVALELMFPLYADEDEEELEKITMNCSKEKDLQLKTDVEDDEEKQVVVPTEIWLQNSLTTKLGEWEKYTKGIGSKLMAKMGYIVGTGLGPKGEGRVDPVSAYVYPQGVSLVIILHEVITACILENQVTVKPFGKWKKRLLNQQKKQEEKEKRHQNYLKANTSVFDIINSKLGPRDELKQPAEASGDSTMNTSKGSLKKDSTKELNKKNLQLSSNIEKLKGEVLNLQKTKNRHANDAATMKVIDKKLQDKKEELSSLQKAANRVEYEQQKRRNIQKLCTF